VQRIAQPRACATRRTGHGEHRCGNPFALYAPDAVCAWPVVVRPGRTVGCRIGTARQSNFERTVRPQPAATPSTATVRLWTLAETLHFALRVHMHPLHYMYWPGTQKYSESPVGARSPTSQLGSRKGVLLPMSPRPSHMPQSPPQATPQRAHLTFNAQCDAVRIIGGATCCQKAGLAGRVKGDASHLPGWPCRGQRHHSVPFKRTAHQSGVPCTTQRETGHGVTLRLAHDHGCVLEWPG
jgi:hypothetical protein